jgi:hypothetical protein
MKVITFLFFIIISYSCNDKKIVGSAAFEYYPHSRSELEASGFEPMRYDLPDLSNTSHKGTKEVYFSKQNLVKEVQDTLIYFELDGDSVINKSVRFEFDTFDSATLVHNLKQLGFVHPSLNYVDWWTKGYFYHTYKPGYKVDFRRKSITVLQEHPKKEAD